MTGIPYVGCGVKSSAVAMDKDLSKRLFRDAGIPTSQWRLVRAGEFDDATRVVDEIVDGFGLPVFVKPAELGSSVGVTRATTDAELKDGLEEAFRQRSGLLIWVKVHPWLDSLRSDPRYGEILKKMGLQA